MFGEILFESAKSVLKAAEVEAIDLVIPIFAETLNCQIIIYTIFKLTTGGLSIKDESFGLPTAP